MTATRPGPASLEERAVNALARAWGLTVEDTYLRLCGNIPEQAAYGDRITAAVAHDYTPFEPAAVHCTATQDGDTVILSCSCGGWSILRPTGYPRLTDFVNHALSRHPGARIDSRVR